MRAGKSLTRESLEKALEEKGVVLQKLEFEERPRAAAAYVIGVPEANISWLPRFNLIKGNLLRLPGVQGVYHERGEFVVHLKAPGLLEEEPVRKILEQYQVPFHSLWANQRYLF
ncbi:MAG: hypothetical protein O7H41_06205 [Planctomycetota bacterium]|nr:hypothetical protein [Planctomycetota bacterium]